MSIFFTKPLITCILIFNIAFSIGKSNPLMVLERADSFFNASYFRQALSLYETVQTAHYSKQQLYHRAVCEVSLGKYNMAETTCSTYIKQDSMNGKVFLLRAKSIYFQNSVHPQFDCIITDTKQAVALHYNADDFLKLLQYQHAAMLQYVNDFKLQKLAWNKQASAYISYCKDFSDNVLFGKKKFPEMNSKIEVLNNAYLNLLNPKSPPVNMYGD